MRTPELLRDGDDTVTLVACLEGRFDIRFADDTAVQLAGQALLMPHHRLGGACVQAGTRTYTLRMTRDVAHRVVPSVDTALLRATAPEDPAFALLSAYCAGLVGLPDELPAATASMAGAQLEELMAHLLGNRDAIDLGGGSGLRAARLCAIKDDIARNLGRCGLSAAMMGERHGVTPRHVQRLFEREGTTFTEYVLAQRLARAHRLLSDPRRAAEKISAIACDAGFAELSYFNRAFRRRFGAAPSEVRARRMDA
jgi:AraC-like DNA-binding protein